MGRYKVSKVPINQAEDDDMPSLIEDPWSTNGDVFELLHPLISRRRVAHSLKSVISIIGITKKMNEKGVVYEEKTVVAVARVFLGVVFVRVIIRKSKQEEENLLLMDFQRSNCYSRRFNQPVVSPALQGLAIFHVQRAISELLQVGTSDPREVA